jgi:ABC-type lipoprotein release transport system permease subunit
LIAFKIALRSVLKRKQRMTAIGALVILGTTLIVFGQTFANSAEKASRDAIIEHFTGDFIVYSEEARQTASPFSFTSPLPVIQDVPAIREYLSNMEEIETFVPFAQNYCVIRIGEGNESDEIPFVFYAVQPQLYRQTFQNLRMIQGSFFASDAESTEAKPGIVVSAAQNRKYEEDYGLTLAPGKEVSILSVISGGSVNAVKATVRGIFEPRFYKNVFDYNSLSARTGGLGDLDLQQLETEQLSGYTLIAVKLSEGADRRDIIERVRRTELPVKVVPWNEASGGFAQIARAIHAFIYVSTVLIFLIVILIFMNTLIINVIERTGEIGTLRAIGGERVLIRRIFVAETLITNSVATAAGMVVSLVAILLTAGSGIPLPETVAQFLVGGGRLPMRITIGPFLQAAGVILAVSIVATLYPVRFAAKISPSEAMLQR